MESLPETVVEGIIRACRGANRPVRTTTTFADPAEEGAYLDLFLRERVAGAISSPSGAPAAAYRRLQQSGAPVVLLDRHVPGLAAPLVRHDFAGGCALAVAHLAARGHRRIGAILPPNLGLWAGQTVAWNAAFDRVGIAPAPDLVGHVGAETGTAATHALVRELLAREHPPTAVVAATATTTPVALRAIRAAGAVGEREAAIVGTGDRRWEPVFPADVPFVRLDSFGLGATAAGILNDAIDGRRDTAAVDEITVAVSFVDGASREE